MNTSDTFEQLRQRFDGSESFMSGGHQIIKVRQSNRKSPEWAKSDVKIREVLLRSFPKMATNAKQRYRAGRWARVIHLYFRMNQSRTRTAQEMNTKVANIKTLIVGINRVARGMRFDGRGVLGRKKGRPKKSTYPAGHLWETQESNVGFESSSLRHANQDSGGSLRTPGQEVPLQEVRGYRRGDADGRQGRGLLDCSQSASRASV